MLFLLVVYAGILLRENDTHVIREHDVPRLSRVKSISVLRDFRGNVWKVSSILVNQVAAFLYKSTTASALKVVIKSCYSVYKRPAHGSTVNGWNYL